MSLASLSVTCLILTVFNIFHYSKYPQVKGTDDTIKNHAIPLTQRHPDAGVWVAYPSNSTFSIDASKNYIKGIMAYVKWNEIFDSNQNYNWGTLDNTLNKIINQAGKKAFTNIPAGYCPDLDWPQFLKNRIARNKTANNKGCYPLQFWDPLYKEYYSHYIYALAKHLAEFDKTDKNPTKTDITFVRAMTMAETMENLPSDSDIAQGIWNYSNFTPAANGHIYKVNLTQAIRDDYAKWVGQEYQDALNTEYQKVGLQPPTAAPKATGYWSLEPQEEYFAQQGFTFWKTSGMPTLEGWWVDMVTKVKSGITRGHSESGQHPRLPYLAQQTYWELLAILHSGTEFIGIYGNNRQESSVQPRGPIGFTENIEAFEFTNAYAGYEREPNKAPGAWIAFHGWYEEQRFSSFQHETIWSDFNMLLTHYRPQDSIALYGTDDRTSPRQTLPTIERNTKQPWTDEQSACLAKFPASECDYLIQQPSVYLGLVNGKHQYTFPQTDLGKVLYCGHDAFCTDTTKVTRTETMFFARQTNKKEGKNHMRFNLNDAFASSLQGKAKIRVVYLDRGTDKWQLLYDADHEAGTITKTNSNIWKEAYFPITGAQFANKGTGGTDLALFNNNDTDDIFHLIEVQRNTVPTISPTKTTPTLLPSILPTNNLTPTLLPAVTTTPTSCPLKKIGDADCATNTAGKQKVDILDYSIWYSEFINDCSSNNTGCGSDRDGDGNTMDANFNYPGTTYITTDSKVDVFDYAVWIQGFVSTN